MSKVLVIDTFPADFLASLRELQIELVYLPQASREQVLAELTSAKILILNSGIRLDRAALEAAPQLELAIRAGVGMDHFDLEAFAEKGIQWKNTQGGNADAVGEQAVGMLLALRNHLVRADRQVRQFQWIREANRGWEIRNKTIGLIGYGFTGQAVARKLSGFQARVLAYDKYRENYGDAYAEEASLEQLFAEAEILSMHVPLTSETHHWVGESFLNRFTHPIHLLNLSRGPVVHLPGLLSALDRKKVLGAALDVLENEKMNRLSPAERVNYENLFARENVLLSPHIGGWTRESLAQINGMIVGFVKDWLLDQASESGR